MGRPTFCVALLAAAIAALAQPSAPSQQPPPGANQPPAAAGPAAKSLPLEVTDNRWTFRARGPWQDQPDRRGLRAMRYPWHVSASGEQAELSRSVTVPADWPAPYALTFFCSDDYSDSRERPKTTGNSIDSYADHRFKEVLVDGRVVWERDIADDSAPGVPTDFAVDVTAAVTPGRPFVVTLRNRDRVGLDTPLPTDFFLRGAYEPDARPGGEHVLATTCYWGDVTLWSGPVARPPAGSRPSTAAVHARHARQWPYPPAGAAARLPAALAVEGPDGPLPTDAPVVCGVPLPEGRVKDAAELSLRLGPARLPWQPEVMNRWPDGSVRWVLVNTVLPAGTPAGARVELAHTPGQAAAPPRAPVTAAAAGRAVTVTAGDLTLTLGGEALIDRAVWDGREVCRGLQPAATWEPVGGPPRPLVVRWESVRLTRTGPVRATVEARGSLADAAGALGPVVCRVDAFANVPAVRVTCRIFNSGAERADLAAVRLAGDLAAGDGPWARSGAEAADGLRVAQVDRDHFAVTAAGRAATHDGRAAGWIAAGAGGRWVRATVRHFWQQFPAALAAAEGRLSLEFVAGSAAAPAYGCRAGEAKRWEAWLGFGSGRPDAAALAAGNAPFDRPVRLFDPAYFCATEGLGYAHPHDGEFAPVAEHMARAHPGAAPETLTLLNGVRDFGDGHYTATTPTYRNNYYDVMRGLFGEYLMGGGRGWFDRGEEAARHYMDVDQFHDSARTRAHVGANASVTTPNHNDDLNVWAAMLRPAGGMLTYWRLSGDEDARESALLLADFVVRTRAGVGASSVRDNAGPMHSLAWAYDETGDGRYRDAALEVARSVRPFLIPRRGCYAETHGSANYRGNVPWMVAQLCEPLYLLYRRTGEVWLADQVVGLMDSVLCENMDPAVPGNFHGYTHAPVLHRGVGANSGYNVLIAPCAGLAYELTGEPAFREAMRGGYRITVEQKTINSVLNCYWMTPTLLYLLHRDGQP